MIEYRLNDYEFWALLMGASWPSQLNQNDIYLVIHFAGDETGRDKTHCELKWAVMDD